MSEYKKIIDTIRKFNRFYTVNMGFLNSNYLARIFKEQTGQSLFTYIAKQEFFLKLK